MNRRAFITLLGGTAVAWPFVARAQQAAMPVVGLLGITSLGNNEARLRAFRQGLKEIGYVEGENEAPRVHHHAVRRRWRRARSSRRCR
jgi:putative ABC transport system substrate-binding protein